MLKKLYFILFVLCPLLFFSESLLTIYSTLKMPSLLPTELDYQQFPSLVHSDYVCGTLIVNNYNSPWLFFLTHLLSTSRYFFFYSLALLLFLAKTHANIYIRNLPLCLSSNSFRFIHFLFLSKSILMCTVGESFPLSSFSWEFSCFRRQTFLSFFLLRGAS